MNDCDCAYHAYTFIHFMKSYEDASSVFRTRMGIAALNKMFKCLDKLELNWTYPANSKCSGGAKSHGMAYYMISLQKSLREFDENLVGVCLPCLKEGKDQKGKGCDCR